MSDVKKEFRILWPWTRPPAERKRLDVPTSVPWGLVAPHEAQAQKNHSQSLERLNQRGGLDPIELVAVLEGRGLDWVVEAQMEDAVGRLKQLVGKYKP